MIRCLTITFNALPAGLQLADKHESLRIFSPESGLTNDVRLLQGAGAQVPGGGLQKQSGHPYTW